MAYNKRREDVETIVVDNFAGAMTLFLNGNLNSGRSWEQSCSGQNPFIKPGQLTWCEPPVLIDSASSVITDLIMDGKERVENGVLFVYAIGHTGRVYKIQVNDPTTFNPDYDNPVLLATLTVNSPTFTKGGFIDFYGTTEKIYIGHDKGLTTINFDGSGEAAVGDATAGHWTQNVPRPLKQFVGNLYVGNGSNIAEIGAAAIVNTYTKLLPGFPTNSETRDIDVSSDGTYLETVVSTLPLYDLTSTAQQTSSTASATSYIFKWNGSDTGYTSFSTFPSYALSANIMFQNYQYTFGTDQFGSAVYAPTEKIISIPEAPAALPNAVFSTGNLLALMTPLHFAGVLQAYMLMWGSSDFEVGHPLGFWSPFFLAANAPETDIITLPCVIPVSNTGYGASSNNYPSNLFGKSKIYFSTLETSAAPTTKYRFYKWSIETSALQAPTGNALFQGLYQTQTQLFSKKIEIKEIRIYGEPWPANMSFQIDLQGSGNTPISGASRTFTTGSNVAIGSDYIWYNPVCAPTYALGLVITNLGTANYTINKVEIDYSSHGGR
jgi:hypothetical protein